jgi:general stress protein YciG
MHGGLRLQETKGEPLPGDIQKGWNMASGTHNRGFASMDAQKQREIARKGGKAAHEKGTAHEFTPDEARAAGRKGGESVSADRSRMAEIGRRGGLISAQRRAQRSGSQPGEQQEQSPRSDSPESSASSNPGSDAQ